jgi:predicted nucleotidyltransferase
VKVKRGTSLFDLVGYEMDLEKIVKRKVDLLTYAAIHPYVKDTILQDEIPIL